MNYVMCQKRNVLKSCVKKLIETNNIEETLMDMYKKMPCSMYETEMALKQAKLKKLNQIKEAKQDAEQVIMRT